MNTLKTRFRLSGLPYTLLKRNEVVALYGIGGTLDDLGWGIGVLNCINIGIYLKNHLGKEYFLFFSKPVPQR